MKQNIIPAVTILLSIAVFVLVAVWAWPNSIPSPDSTRLTENTNATLADCAGYYLWNKIQNEPQANILSQKYDLVELERTAESKGFTVAWPTVDTWISLRKKVDYDTYKISIQNVSSSDERQRITAVWTTACNKSDQEVKRSLLSALTQLDLETAWIDTALVEIDGLVQIEDTSLRP